MIESVEPTIELSTVSARRGQFTQSIEITNRLGYPIAVITKTGINAVIHPALSITTDGTISVAVTFSANHHSTLNQLPNFYKENPALAKKVPAISPKNPKGDMLTLEYTLTDEQLNENSAHYIDDLDMVICTGIGSKHIHPRSAHYTPPCEQVVDVTTLTLRGCGSVSELYYVLFADFVVPIKNTVFGINSPSLTIASTDQNIPVKTETLSSCDIFESEEDALAERTRRTGSYNDITVELTKGVKSTAEAHFKMASGVSKEYVTENTGLVSTVNDMSSAVSKLEQDIADAKIHQRKVAGEAIKLVHPLVTTIGKVATL